MQFCAGVKVLRDWGIVAVNGDSTVSEVFHGVSSGQIESADGFRLPKQYADLSSPFLSVHCKNLRVVLTLLWVISVACSGASIIPSV